MYYFKNDDIMEGN